MTRRTAFTRLFAATVLAVALTAAPAAAAPSPAAAPLFAGYWHDFIEHWVGALKQQNGIIVAALGVGAVSLFIITRGKWLK